MKRPVRRALRGCVSLALALAALWAASAAATADSLGDAARSLGMDGTLALALVRWERGDFLRRGALTLPSAFVLRATPLLLAREDEITASWTAEPDAPETPDAAESRVGDAPDAAEPAAPEERPTAEQPSHTPRDNGVPATTLRPSDPAGYLVRGAVYVHNTSAAPLGTGDLEGGFSAVLTAEKPQVLIVHTHGCEAYTMPSGEEYVASDDHRTLDEAYNVVRVGDELARVLEDAGIGVLHDRTLHDYPSYSGAYNRSLATVESYRAQYPSLVYVLDVHRDAVEDESGRQYKLLCAEEPGAAQLEFVLGSDGGGLAHDHWRDNLRLACAIQQTLLEDYPTLMRPIVVRNSRYNQQVSTGALLLEVGTAGNSLDEALAAARLFGAGFAKTLQNGG